MFPSRQSSVELKLLMHSLHREKYQDFPLEGSKQDLLTTIIFLNTVNLPQRLVEGEAREVEETQVLFCHHAVKVVTAEKKNASTAASEDKVLRLGAPSGQFLAVCNISRSQA